MSSPQPSGSISENLVTDDDVFRRKLLMDGEGMGDDRRLNILLRTFLKWCDADVAEEDFEAGYTGLLCSLQQSQFLMNKSHLSQLANKREIKNYEELEKEIKQQIIKARLHINEKKQELENAINVQKNKHKYDGLAMNIINQPDRKETLNQLKKVEDEIKQLESVEKILKKRQDKKHQQLYALLTSADELHMLEESDVDSETEM